MPASTQNYKTPPSQPRQSFLLDRFASFYDTLFELWERPGTSRRVSLLLTLAFGLTVAAMAFSCFGLLPASLAVFIPTDPFFPIRIAFSLILGVEVIELIFAIADSLSQAVGKQMEIMALILLRECFTDISLLTAQTDASIDWLLVLQVGSTALAGLLLFIFRGLFARWYKGLSFNDNILIYINAKKAVSLLLFVSFIASGAYDLHGIFVLGKAPVFFQIFYTSLIFTDILLVLISQYFMPCFQATFRNSGYAVGTLLMRIALGTPHHLSAALCVFSGLYLLAMAWATSRFSLPLKRGQSTEQPESPKPL